MMSIAREIQKIVYGLALGDSLASPSADHRVSLLAPKRILRIRVLNEYVDNLLQTTRPTPYTHAQPGFLLNPAPSDDAEWFAFTALAHMNKTKSIEQCWRDLSAKRDQVRGRTGTKIALRNLDQGSSLLHAGHDNPHYFDDIACIRAIAAGILANGSIEKAVELALADASFTHSEDGVWAAQSIAALFAALLSGKSRGESVEIALSQFPDSSWGKRVIHKAISIAKDEGSPIARSLKLENECVDRIYSYGISAPETLSLLFAHLLNAQSGEELLLSTFLHKRNLDALPALAGAVAATAYEDQWIPEKYLGTPLLLDGVCIPELKGVDLAEISKQLTSSLNG